MKRMVVGLCVAVSFSAAGAAGEFPNSDLVIKFLNSPDTARTVALSCQGVGSNDAKYADCWGAKKAVELLDKPADTKDLILSPAKRKDVKAKCDAMSMKERFESRPCQALVQASNFFMFLGSPHGKSSIRF